AAQGDCAERRQGNLAVQPGNGDIFRILAESLQCRRRLLRSGGDRSTSSRQVRAGIRHCRTGSRAEWRPGRDAGYLHGCPSRRGEITSLAARYRLPAVYPYRQFTAVGGLLSYGDDLIDNFRRAPTYVDRILKGERPRELPVQAPVKFQLVVNLNTAKALGLTVPPSPLSRADEVI